MTMNKKEQLLPPWHSNDEIPNKQGWVVFEHGECVVDIDEYKVERYKLASPWAYLDDIIALSEQSTRPTGDVQILIEGIERAKKEAKYNPKQVDTFEVCDKLCNLRVYLDDALEDYEASKGKGGVG